MPARDPIELDDSFEPTLASIPLAAIDAPEHRMRAPDFGPALDELIESIKRGGLLQPIGVKCRADKPGRFTLIWGRRRLEAFRRDAAPFQKIPAVIYSEDLPLEWAKILEIDENEKRQDLSADERAEHALVIAAELRKLEELASPVKSDKSEFSNQAQVQPEPRTGRGHKGMVQKVAERQKVDHAAVRKRVKKVSETIGEQVDLERDSVSELSRKADKFRAQIADHKAERKASRQVARQATREHGPSLLDAMRGLIWFSPTEAQRWMEDHPEHREKILGMVPSISSLMAVLAGRLSPTYRTAAAAERPPEAKPARSILPMKWASLEAESAALAQMLADRMKAGATAASLAAEARRHAEIGIKVTAAKVEVALVGQIVDDKVRQALWAVANATGA